MNEVNLMRVLERFGCDILKVSVLISAAVISNSFSAFAQVPFTPRQMASLSCGDLGFPIFDAEIDRRVNLPNIEYLNVNGNESNQKGNSFEAFAINSLYLNRNNTNYSVTGWSTRVRPDAVNALLIFRANGTISIQFDSQFYDAKATPRIANNNQGKKYLDYLSIDAPSVRQENVPGNLDYITIRDTSLSDTLYNTSIVKGVGVFQTFACDPGNTVSPQSFQIGVNDMRVGKSVLIAPGSVVVYFNYTRPGSMFRRTQGATVPPTNPYN